MGRALDQCAIGVEESIFLPFQRCAQVRAAISIQEYLVVFLDGKQKCAGRLDSLRSSFFYIFPVQYSDHWLCNSGQGLFEILQQVFGIFDAHGEADH